MGIYLGQLPPAEIARLKAELAETLIAHFCYPRFFDHRTESLQMRPVDRAKRQEVWLYLSSVDFTAWSRIDLASSEFQNQIESLFIQFVQRNRNFFGEQGRRRMPDIRTLINENATAVSQRLREHLAGPKQMVPPFGSPRPVVSWGVTSISGKSEPGWEQISASTQALQQQLQEMRGEGRVAVASDGRSATTTGALGTSAGSANSAPRRMYRPQPQAGGIQAGAAQQPSQTNTGNSGVDLAVAQQLTVPTPPVQTRPAVAETPAWKANGNSANSSLSQASPVMPATMGGYAAAQAHSAAVEPAIVARKPEPQIAPAEPAAAPRRTESMTPGGAFIAKPSMSPPSTSIATASKVATNGRIITPTEVITPSGNGTGSRNLSAQSAASGVTANNTHQQTMSVGEDDIAIFEQLRHQLVLWLRVEALTAGVELTTQTPAQLLDILRQQVHLDETRLQVVSTLLNLSNQVIKTGIVSVLDYKQALMFHLMHTKR